MCGIAGFVSHSAGRDLATTVLGNMLEPIRHRGPDDCGIWCASQDGIALGHRRLSILELSHAGHQPMESGCGRFVIVFNGEIYNHLELRSRLDKLGLIPQTGWRGHSDTETLLACVGALGVEETLQLSVGMFALVLWDKRDRSLTLARDRLGEKPLYYGWQDGTFLFGSELKSLRAHPTFRGDLDWEAASTFLRLNYVPAPSTIFQGIYKLAPGTFLRLTQGDIQRKAMPRSLPYWSLSDVALNGLGHPFAGSLQDAADELELLIRQSVQLQSVADVPVGAFLSGGIDSSTVVAMMKSATTSKVTTFCIGMVDAKMDESQHAAAVARHLGTHHVEHFIQPSEALDLIPRLPEIWDEPFADSSQIPTYLVSQLAKQHVTVALSGDGGDELFLGYPQYALYQKLWRTRYLGALPWDAAFAALLPMANRHLVGAGLRRAKYIVSAWRQPNTQALNRYWMDRYREGDVPLRQQRGVALLGFPVLPDAASTAGLWDSGTSLPDDILVKVDRAAMANSLETRAPLLDHRVVEFALRLPQSFKLATGSSKRVLREVLYRHVPRRMIERPKVGFSIPLAAWLRQELRPWVETVLGTISGGDGPWNAQEVKHLWRQHLLGERDRTEQLWGILVLQSFLLQNSGSACS